MSDLPPNAPMPPTTPSSPLLQRLKDDQRAIIATLADAFEAEDAELYLVGGPVRDLLLAQDVPADLDFATSVPPSVTKKIGARIPNVGLYDIGEKFGTIGIVMQAGGEPTPVEITTFRSEQYAPGSRHPDVAYGTSIEDDLARRDVTVNAIAIEVRTGEIIDPFYGQADLAMGMLRAVGDPDDRFAEDPLRLLRVARFVGQLGFGVEAETRAAMERQAQTLETISAERIFSELTKLLCGPYADHALDVLLDTGLFTTAMPELLPLANAAENHPGIHREKDLWDHTKQVIMQAPARPMVRWAALLHDAAKPLTRSVDERGEVHFFGHEYVGADIAWRLLGRLKADKTTRQHVRRIVELHLRPAAYDAATWTDSAVRRLAMEAGDVLHDLMDLAAADVTSGRVHKRRAAAARVQGLKDHIARLEAELALDQLQSPLDGNELMAMFERPPGKWIAEIKDHLREMVIDGDLAPDDKQRATAIAHEIMNAQ
jgi:poly(A) polymerase